MNTFKEFFQLSLNKEESVSSSAIRSVSSAVISAIPCMGKNGLISNSLVSGSLLSQKDVEKFSKQVGDLVGSEEFVTDLSFKIDVPLPNESEDDFVKRAKESMKKLMRAKLAGKS